MPCLPPETLSVYSNGERQDGLMGVKSGNADTFQLVCVVTGKNNVVLKYFPQTSSEETQPCQGLPVRET
ncbi:UNVERIFIED_CONTAM: hypothetical protein FKN15_041769 [Acipenser sinensis]